VVEAPRVCDELLARSKMLKSKPDDPFVLTKQVPDISYDR
jgi:hypothetical protein